MTTARTRTGAVLVCLALLPAAGGCTAGEPTGPERGAIVLATGSDLSSSGIRQDLIRAWEKEHGRTVRIVKLPDNLLFRVIGSFNMVQELLFYRVRPVPALRYFANTVLVTGKSGLSMTMRTIPSLFRKRTEPIPQGTREIYEANRGYF